MQYNVTINLTPAQLQQIIADHFAKEGKKVDPKNIKFEVDRQHTGYGDDAYVATVFCGCKVEFTDGE